MDKLKYIKLENEDGSYSDSIPLAVDSDYVDVNGTTLTRTLGTLVTKDEIQFLASGSPAGVYSTVAELTTADPDHDRIYVVSEDGHWYYYSQGWQDGGVYQATEISDDSINILKLDDFIKDNVSLQFGEDLDLGELLPGYCNGSLGGTVTIAGTEGSTYKHYEYDLTKGKIYNFVGITRWSVKALLITDENGTIVYVGGSGGAAVPVATIFEAKQNNLKAYISLQMYSTKDSQPYFESATSIRLRELSKVVDNMKVNEDIVLLNTYTDTGIFSHTIDEMIQLKQAGTLTGYTTKVYAIEKGRHYKIKCANQWFNMGITITDNKYYIKYTSFKDTTSVKDDPVSYDGIATEDGYLFLSYSTTSELPHTVEISYSHIPVEISVDQEFYPYIKGKHIIYDGDSITESRIGGTHQNGGGFPKIIADMTNSTYTNYARGGGWITTGNTTRSVIDNVVNLPTDADMYVFSGGINDFWANKVKGTVTDGYTDTLDETTIAGAMESLFRYALTNFVGKPIVFVITHKIGTTPYIPNRNGDTFKDYHDIMVAVCNKYSIPYYDAYNRSGLNGWNDAQNAAFLDANAQRTPDRCHPNAEGYKRYYVPQLIELYNELFKR